MIKILLNQKLYRKMINKLSAALFCNKKRLHSTSKKCKWTIKSQWGLNYCWAMVKSQLIRSYAFYMMKSKTNLFYRHSLVNDY